MPYEAEWMLDPCWNPGPLVAGILVRSIRKREGPA